MWLKRARRTIYWLLPGLLLVAIFQYIDVGLLRQNLAHTDLPILLAGLLLFPVTTLIGAIRWRVVLTAYNRVSIPFFYTVIQYFIGMTSGLITPGAIGLDIYRVFVMGRRYGNYVLNTVVVLVEKFIALVTCMLLVVALYPFLITDSAPRELSNILHVATALLALASIIVFIIILIDRNTALREMARATEGVIRKKLLSVVTQMKLPETRSTLGLSLREMIGPLRKSFKLPLIFLLSLGIQANSALAVHILFNAAGYEISYLINLFLSPVFFILFLIPVSFAGIGVREASFIILYGFFGVPAETAVLVGFFSLTGTLATSIFGGLLMYSNKELTE